MVGFWQYSANHDLFFYGRKDKGGAYAAEEVKGTPKGQTSLGDWKREIASGLGKVWAAKAIAFNVKPRRFQEPQFYINGKTIAELLIEMLNVDVNLTEAQLQDQTAFDQMLEKLQFNDVSQLEKFFSEQLFSKVENAEDKEFLSRQALVHFHQGGLPFASHHCLVTANMSKASGVKFSNEKIKVNFIPIKNGLSIVEDNIYPTVMVGKRKIRPSFGSDYCAKTHSEVSFTTKGIHIQNLTIDAPNSYAANLVDLRTLEELLQHIIDKLMQVIRATISMETKRQQAMEVDVANLDEKAVVMCWSSKDSPALVASSEPENDLEDNSNERLGCR